MSLNILPNGDHNDNNRPTALGWVPEPRFTKNNDIWRHCRDSKVHGANMGPIWGRQDPGGSHVDPMNFAIWLCIYQLRYLWNKLPSEYGEPFKIRGLNHGVFLLKASFYKIIYCWSKERRLLISASDMQSIAWLSYTAIHLHIIYSITYITSDET